MWRSFAVLCKMKFVGLGVERPSCTFRVFSELMRALKQFYLSQMWNIHSLEMFCRSKWFVSLAIIFYVFVYMYAQGFCFMGIWEIGVYFKWVGMTPTQRDPINIELSKEQIKFHFQEGIEKDARKLFGLCTFTYLKVW